LGFPVLLAPTVGPAPHDISPSLEKQLVLELEVGKLLHKFLKIHLT
jgi:hypothetical protein